jgi:hypothetical protein
MKNWMSMMTLSAVAHSTFLLLPTIPLKTFSLIKTSPFLISLTTPSRRYLSSSALPSLSTDIAFNFSDSSGHYSIHIF